MVTGTASYFDGTSSQRRMVAVAVGAVLRITETDGTSIAEWSWREVERLDQPGTRLRLARIGGDARLELADEALASAAEAHIAKGGAPSRSGGTLRIVGWSIAAVVSLSAVRIFGLPVIADKLAPYVPYSLERKIGEAVDGQVRTILSQKRGTGTLECGAAEAEKAGKAAFDKLMATIVGASEMPGMITASVIRRSDANAIALPGGRIYVFHGLITKAGSPDEVAGVIGHEIGHVENRDGMRKLIQSAGLSFLFGMLLGDVVGGGAIVVASRTLLDSAYSREAETRADAFGVALMKRAKGDPAALATILEKIAGTEKERGALDWILDHPATPVRARTIRSIAGAPGQGQPLLTADEWAALRRICVP